MQEITSVKLNTKQEIRDQEAIRHKTSRDLILQDRTLEMQI